MSIDKIYNMDCLEGLKALPENIIDLTVTSPPYDNLRSYGNVAKWDGDFFCQVAAELLRVTKPGGIVVWVVGDATLKGSETGSSFRQALYFMELGFRLHDTMIYQKTGFAYPETNRYYPSFEYMFIFSVGKPKTVNLIKDRPNSYAGQTLTGTDRLNDGSLVAASAVKKGINRKIKDFSVRSNIWMYKVGKWKTTKDCFAFAHPAMFPEELAKDHIHSWSNPGDLVLDPFMGSGTTAKMAILMERHYYGYEINREYYDIAVKRVDLVKRDGYLNSAS